MSIKAIFYSKFDTQEGSKVIHQVPEGSIVSSPDSPEGAPFFSFPSISSFIIPRQSLCGNPISIVPPPAQTPNCSSSQSYRILGHPICLTSPTYLRNEFIFNFCLVLSANDPDFNAYKSVVTKLAHLMQSLEEQSHFLSRDTCAPNTGKLYSLCETLISDLNNYCECMIPIDELNTLNLKLFPTYAPPPPVKGWHVPIFTVRPESLMDENWDLTMQRIVPHINGVSSVKHISILADADLGLTKECIKHLLYYGCLLLLDIFSFTAIYAPTAEFAGTIASDEEMQRECASYVNTAFAPSSTADRLDHVVKQHQSHAESATPTTSDDDVWPLDSSGRPVDGVGIVELFAALKQGQSVREWYAANSDMLASIDLRRFITFGVIKGFVYRVHKYAYASGHGANTARSTGRATSKRGKWIRMPGAQTRGIPTATTATALPVRGKGSDPHLTDHEDNLHADEDEDENESESENHNDNNTPTVLPTNPLRPKHHHHHHRRKHARNPNTLSFPPSSSSSSSSSDEDTPTNLNPAQSAKRPSSKFLTRLSRYLDGAHCFDQICTELEISEVELEALLRRRWGGRDGGGGGAAAREGAGAGAGAGAGDEVLIIHR
ncbi:hypothetical protein GJ744_000869 [Endocarpon pusillum]|uniref:Nitrogen permease regulator 2 n=1 Tax=Endocarpon pusillum TaxID=364733 RepID=A0A8H7E8Y8_9EURO|nr:hypothetical protein GJ744_000869 [Endocarpon pusillum]